MLAAGLCLIPAAASDAGTAWPHVGQPQSVNAAAHVPVAAPDVPGGGRADAPGQAPGAGGLAQARWHGNGGPSGGDQGRDGAWGGPHSGPGQAQGGWSDSGSQGQSQAEGQGGWGGSSGQSQAAGAVSGSASATPQVGVPSTSTPATSSPPSPSISVYRPGGHPWGGAGSGHPGENPWGGSHGSGQGSGSSDSGHHNGWGSGHGDGNGDGSGKPSGSGSGSSGTPASQGGSSSSSSSSSSSATPAVTTAASGGSSTPAPAASAPSTTTPVVVSVNPAQPAPSKGTGHAGGGAPTGKPKQQASSRPGATVPSGRVDAAHIAAATGSSRGITAAASGLPRALTAGAPSPAAPANAAGKARRHRTAASSLPQPLNTLGHELSSVPSLVSGFVPLPVPDWSKPIIFALLLVCALLAFRAWLTGHRARRIEAESRQLAADLASIQSALIPEIPATLGGLDVSVAYRPADGPGAGGDFYDAFALDADRVAIIVGDVSGHGREALGRAAHMHYTLRAYVEMGLEPRAALKLAGRVLGADQDDLFTTVAVAVHDAAAGTLTYATAGHPAPVLLGPAAHQPLTRCASPALGWGVATGRRQTTVPFGEGARACFFTDGVTEARVEDELLGRERLGDMLRQLGPEAGARQLLESVQRQAPTVHDDMAACIVAATTGTFVSELRTEELEVDARQIGAGQAERFLTACGVSPAEAESVVADAREIASEGGAALLRVEIDGDEATATAAGPAPGRPELQQA